MGILETVGSVNKPSWRSAVCGCLPIALAVLWADWSQILSFSWTASHPVHFNLTIGEGTWDLHSGPYNYTFVLNSLLGSLAAIGIFSQTTNVRLARASFYLSTIHFILLTLSLIAATIGIIPLAMSVDESALSYLIAAYVMFIFIVIFEYWVLQLHRSLYQILAVGGSGWEYLTADEILLDKKAQSVEEGQESHATPLLATTTTSTTVTF